MVLQTPERTESVTVRLTPMEKMRLAEVALARDVRVGQLVRQIVNHELGAHDADEGRSPSSDGA